MDWQSQSKIFHYVSAVGVIEPLNVTMEFLLNIITALMIRLKFTLIASKLYLVFPTHTTFTQLRIISSYTPEDGAPVTD